MSYLSQVGSAFKFASTITGAIGSSKAKRAQALQQEAMFDLLFSISGHLTKINEGLQEVISQLDKLPSQMKKELGEFEAQRYHANILGIYKIFIERKTDFLRRPDLWGNESARVELISDYEDLLVRLQIAARSLFVFPLSATPIKDATICLSFQAEMDILSELDVMGNDESFSASIEAYKDYFDSALIHGNKIELRISELNTLRAGFGSDLETDAPVISYRFFMEGVTDFFEPELEEETLTDDWETKGYVRNYTLNLHKVNQRIPLSADVSVTDIEFHGRKTCLASHHQYFEEKVLLSTSSKQSPEGCLDQALRNPFNENFARDFRGHIATYNAWSFEVASWQQVLSCMRLCRDRSVEMLRAHDLDPRIASKLA